MIDKQEGSPPVFSCHKSGSRSVSLVVDIRVAHEARHSLSGCGISIRAVPACRRRVSAKRTLSCALKML